MEAESTHMSKSSSSSSTAMNPRLHRNSCINLLNVHASLLPSKFGGIAAEKSTAAIYDPSPSPSASKRAKTSHTVYNDQVMNNSDPLDMKFSILRQLLPRGSELQEKDDLLKVVFEYVKDLERQIQTFKYEDSSAGMDIASEEMGALQKKGLCIVQLSKLTKAF